MKKFLPQNFNDLLALFLIVAIIPGLWLLQGIGVIKSFPSDVNGALILAWGLIIQFYFRKVQDEGVNK